MQPVHRTRASRPPGRFLSRDPMGYFDSMNLYGFENNNPVCYRDPSGEVLIPLIAIGELLWSDISEGKSPFSKGSHTATVGAGVIDGSAKVGGAVTRSATSQGNILNRPMFNRAALKGWQAARVRLRPTTRSDQESRHEPSITICGRSGRLCHKIQ